MRRSDDALGTTAHTESGRSAAAPWLVTRHEHRAWYPRVEPPLAIIKALLRSLGEAAEALTAFDQGLVRIKPLRFDSL